MTVFEERVLQRLDAIERLLERLAGDVEGPLLREISRLLGGRVFTSREVTQLAEDDEALRAALVRAVGAAQATRKLGWWLSRCESVERAGEDAQGIVWVLVEKPSLRIDPARGSDDDMRLRRV